MKFLVLCLTALSSANMLMPPAPLKCSPNSNKINHGCLRGQYCHENRCSTSPYISERSSGPFDVRVRPRQASATTDGSCGAQNGGTVCGNWPRGNCCSEYGWCGNSAAHCGTGCQSGGCLSSPPTTLPATADGSCGASNGGTVCGNWPQGNCCSEYGYCGKTNAHCGAGCQSGDCVSLEPVPTAPVTTDGSCGSENEDAICGNWPDGNCCSPYGYCGQTSGHCGAGCQSGDCLTQEVPAPGPSPAPAHPTPGVFNIVGQAGVPAMHAALMPNGRVVFLDKVENYTQVMLPNGHYAYSSEYDPITNTYVGLSYSTNAFCSGGAFLRDGRVVSLGGNGPLEFIDPTVKDGFDGIRYLGRAADGSQNGQNWQETGNKLASARWYASVQTMPDGTLFCASGSLNGLDAAIIANNNPTYEILDAQGVSSGKNIPMDILQKNQPYYMYRFIHLLNDGTLFVFTAKSSQRFNVQTNSIVAAYPDLPGDYRTYPNTGGSVMLPLSRANNWAADILICGGGAFQDLASPTDPSCGRLAPLSAAPAWEMDAMPEGRGMVEAVLLPDGTVLWLNGGSRGAQGFGLMQDPAQEALLYTPSQPLGRRWATLARSAVPRLYHSVALLLLDGRMLVAGSNPVEMPVLAADARTPFATEFRVETYTPPYLRGAKAARRPAQIKLSATRLAAGGAFEVEFVAPEGARGVEVVLYHGGFVTHSVHMNQRMVVLDVAGFVAQGGRQRVVVGMPPSGNVVPPGPYVVYVLVDGVPGVGQFVSVV